MTSPVTAVFPQASTRGGVERVVAEFLRYHSPLRPTTFVGERCEVPNIRTVPVRVPSTPGGLRPWAFRNAAARALQGASQLGTTVSFGANCPPGDVYWVGSVHRAWVERGGQIRFRGHDIPSGVRKLMPRHQVLLALEADYFGRHLPRAMVCTSQQEVDDLAEFYGVPREITHVLPNGYDPLTFGLHRRDQERAAARASMGATEDEIVLLMVANEWHRKGLGPLVEAVAAVGDERLRIDLVGRKSPEDYLPLAQRLGIADRLHWHGQTSDAGFFMAGADVFVLPTTYEPFGIVIIEAMASGLPVVTSRLAGAACAINSGENGLLLDDPTDASELAAAVRVAMDPNIRERWGRRAATSVARYEWSRIFEQADAIIWGA